MSGENVVRILVTSDNVTQPGFDEASAGAEAMAGKVDAAMTDYQAAMERVTAAQAEFDGAQKAQADAAAEVSKLQSDEAASADELAAAQDRLTGASLAAADARKTLANAEADVAAKTALASDEQVASGIKSDASAGMFAGAGAKLKMAAIGIGVGMGLAVKGAANFQQETVRLVTSAGESAKSLGMVQRGILALSVSTNTSSSQLASGMYMVESAGFHGANGLMVLKAAAQGAAAEGADLADVGNAVTSGLNAYGLSAKSATSFTDMMVTAVGQGKMTMQDLASSLSAVLPIAASAHISFAQVGGAIATMTMQGMSARQAAQDLANSIRALLNPNAVATNEMNQFGVSSVDVANKLGSRGLSGTIGYLADTIAKQMGPSGDIILKTFNQSKSAAQAAQTMLSALPPKVQEMGKAYLDGTMSYKSWHTATQGLPLALRTQADQFAATAANAHGFNNLLKSGQPDAQTFAAALGKMMGGATGLNTALMLTGPHASQFSANVKAIAGSAKGAGANVKGWGDIQKEANFQLGSAAKAIKAMGDSLGLALLPAVTATLKPLTSFLGAVAGNKAASAALAVVVGGVLAGALGGKLARAFKDTQEGLGLMAGGIEKLLVKMGVMTAATDAEAAATEGAAVAQDGLNVALLANPITLIIAALVLLVVGFIELWKHCAAFRDFWKTAWRDVSHIVAVAVDFIKAHWKLIVALILGPLGLVIDGLVTHWSAVKHGFEAAWHFVESVVRAVTGAILGVIRPWIRMIETDLDWFGKLASLFWGWWSAAANAVNSGIGTMIGFVESIPGRINSALGGLPAMMFQAGVHVIESLLGGITSMVGSIGSTMGGIAHKVAGFFGLSPAKEGPLSGGGAPEIRGQHFVRDLAAGMRGGLPELAATAARVSAATVPQMSSGRGYGAAGYGGGYGTGGGAALALDVRFGGTDSQIIKALWPYLKLEVRQLGGGGPFSAQKALGSTWPAGA